MSKIDLFNIFEKKKVIRPGWVPFSGVHSGLLKKYSAKEILQDGSKLLESIIEVAKIYNPDGIPVIFDLQVEAEILGCELTWYDNTPPTVSSHPLKNSKTIPCRCLLPTKEDGRLPLILETMRKAKSQIGNDIALYGLICGPFTLASHLRGSDIFLDMYEDEQYVNELIDFCKDVVMEIAKLYIEAGMDIIAYVDPLVSQISTEHFEQFLTKPYMELFTSLKSNKIYSSFFVCGDATRNIEAMCKTSPDQISIDENINIREAKEITDRYDIVIGGNIQLTVTMLHGSQNDNSQAVVNIIDDCGFNNLIVSPGCDMPYDTPIENVIAVANTVHNYEKTKEILKDYSSDMSFEGIEVKLPTYNELDKPLVEICTLDSSGCAACSYMVNVVNDLYNENSNLFDFIEYKYTLKENMVRFTKMNVSHLPALYINGNLAYSSLIPSKTDLKASISEYLK